MTVIAYRNGVMASDSGTWSGEFLICRNSKKVFKVRGHLFGCMGEAAVSRAILEEFTATGRLNPTAANNGTQIMVVTPARRLLLLQNGNKLPSLCEYGFYADGSEARAIALGAMMHGASATEAIRYAIKIGPWCAGKVQSVRL